MKYALPLLIILTACDPGYTTSFLVKNASDAESQKISQIAQQLRSNEDCDYTKTACGRWFNIRYQSPNIITASEFPSGFFGFSNKAQPQVNLLRQELYNNFGHGRIEEVE